MRILFTVVLTMLGAACLAQPGGPDTPAPIDGGVAVLIAAGAAYGTSKARKRKALDSEAQREC
ncbi:PID-CTERM protein-sorting domain-containing protein [Phaeocystidibacter luteus]|uniref:Uncharacterized protein n=1 Tax=Phaeocystidibacter luteus TaxID=911197 RepID=A0A6N6RDT3_9FLAO|nr:hypothetical protein [Phaeocystidibacter luteus]KAB2807641.1 hypothetical protein F8C67_11410 [Phaeocystidibacter luteus]